MKRLQKVDELVQLAETTLRKIRVQHERYRLKKIDNERHYGSSADDCSDGEERRPKKKIVSLYEGEMEESSSDSSISAPSKEMKPVTERSEENVSVVVSSRCIKKVNYEGIVEISRESGNLHENTRNFSTFSLKFPLLFGENW